VSRVARERTKKTKQKKKQKEAPEAPMEGYYQSFDLGTSRKQSDLYTTLQQGTLSDGYEGVNLQSVVDSGYVNSPSGYVDSVLSAPAVAVDVPTAPLSDACTWNSEFQRIRESESDNRYVDVFFLCILLICKHCIGGRNLQRCRMTLLMGQNTMLLSLSPNFIFRSILRRSKNAKLSVELRGD
jgi:hypothetical protein